MICISPIQCNYKKAGTAHVYDRLTIGNESVDFIKRHKNETFFFWLPHLTQPMLQCTALEEDLNLFSAIEDDLRQTYCAMVYRLDKNVGETTRAHFSKKGWEENTPGLFF